VFITIAVIVGIVGTLWLARRGFSKTYTEYALFEWGAGLKTGQPVLLAGVQVGYVDEVELRRNGRLFVTLGIERQYQIPQGSVATVQPVGFFGDQSVAIKPTTLTSAPMPPGDTIPAGASAPSISDLLVRMDTLSHAVTEITHAIEVQMVDKGGLSELRQTIESARGLIQQLDTTVAAQSRGLTLTLNGLRRTLGAIDSASVDSTVHSLQNTSQNLAALTANLQHMTATLNVAAAKLNSDDGTAGKLLNDPALYMDLRDVITQMDSLLSDIKQNPKRYINLSIF
jgi:phospholipid/cholesterol/gamma-HCH transport system substrate-binding protein